MNSELPVWMNNQELSSIEYWESKENIILVTCTKEVRIILPIKPILFKEPFFTWNCLVSLE